MRPVDLALDRFESGFRRCLGVPRCREVGFGHDPLRDRHRGLPIRALLELALGCGEVLRVSQSS